MSYVPVKEVKDHTAMVEEKFEWFSKVSPSGQYKSVSTQDVTIRECKAQKTHPTGRFNITLRNGVDEKFGVCVDIAPYKNRIFFRASTEGQGGYKIYAHGNERKNPFIQVNVTEKSKILKEFEGNYDLQYDEFYELYYIEKK